MKNVSFVTNTMTYRCFLNDLLLKGSHQSNPEESMKERQKYNNIRLYLI